MSATLFRLRCGRCAQARDFTGTLEDARKQLCGHCSVRNHYEARMTVVGRNELQPIPPLETPTLEPVMNPPDGGLPFWRITTNQETEARRILEVAFGKD